MHILKRNGMLGMVGAMGVLAMLSGCVKIPQGVEPVEDFALNPYLGKWYEIARLNHSFERGLSRVTARYSMREDGGVRVINRGYREESGEWDEAEGRAYFVEEPDRGFLKVSFFGPFFGSYVVMEWDPDSHAYVCGPNKEFLWLLAREPEVSESRKQHFVDFARERGFPVGELIWVRQQSP